MTAVAVLADTSGMTAAQFDTDETFRPAIERAGAMAIWGAPENWTVHKLIVSPSDPAA
ncbi:MAG: hypothetical protein ACLP50_12655 [Solirubrobacteraceae bacterium]